MKKLIMATLTAAAVMGSASAFAADGQINFTGSVLDQGCTVTNTPTAPLNVNLGTISKSVFSGKGSTAAATEFQLNLKSCPEAVTTATIKFDGTSVDGDPSLLALTNQGADGVAKGVGIQLSDDANTVLPINTASKSYNLQAGKDKENNLTFVARYIATDATVGAGSANSTASFTINYN